MLIACHESRSRWNELRSRATGLVQTGSALPRSISSITPSPDHMLDENRVHHHDAVHEVSKNEPAPEPGSSTMRRKQIRNRTPHDFCTSVDDPTTAGCRSNAFNWSLFHPPVCAIIVLLLRKASAGHIGARRRHGEPRNSPADTVSVTVGRRYTACNAVTPARSRRCQERPHSAFAVSSALAESRRPSTVTSRTPATLRPVDPHLLAR